MSTDALHKNLTLLGAGIEACLEKKLPAPALILLYSGIDIIGWIASDQPFATRYSFISWVDQYLLKARTLPCTAVDLYAARCGLVHTLTPESQLSVQQKAKRLYYAWGDKKAEDLQCLLALSGRRSDCIAVHVNDLYEAWRIGVSTFLEELDKKPEKKSRVCEKAALVFSNLDV